MKGRRGPAVSSLPPVVAESEAATSAPSAGDLVDQLAAFCWEGRPTTATTLTAAGVTVPVFANEFWTSRQRAASRLHEVSYRACFKPQLPAFFISRLTAPGDIVYDPFMGRGTTVLEAAMLGRVPRGCDVNPLSHVLALPRLEPPSLADVDARLAALDLAWPGPLPEDLLVFFHPDTLREILALRAWLLARESSRDLDATDRWIRMVAVNRLTGHSPGFFSVYTLPPNQAASVGAQRKINARRNQTPPRRDVRRLIHAKSKSLLAGVTDDARAMLARVAAVGHGRLARRDGPRRERTAAFHVGSSADTFWEPRSVDLVVTSPPFLDVVNYAGDNWLRCWFCGIDAGTVPIAVLRRLDDWQAFIGSVFEQLARLLRPGGHVAFEVGEVRGGSVRLEEAVLPLGVNAGLTPLAVVVNTQTFTKTANIWGVSNNTKGTNSNRIVVFRK